MVYPIFFALKNKLKLIDCAVMLKRRRRVRKSGTQIYAKKIEKEGDEYFNFT